MVKNIKLKKYVKRIKGKSKIKVKTLKKPLKRRSFDIIGDIGIIEADNKKTENMFIRKITETYPRVKSILKKESETKGKFRRKDLRIVFKDWKKVKKSGLKTTETIHKENGCFFKMDIKKVFFNPRDGTIRNVIVDKADGNETVLVMFSGVGPYCVELAKKGCKVFGIEVNPHAVSYSIENAKINRVENRVKIFEGDVKDFVGGFYDRIVMPLGLDSWKYIDIAIGMCRKGGTIHLFGLGKKNNPLPELEEIIKKAVGDVGRKYKIDGIYVIRSYSSELVEICVDFKVF